MCLVCFVSAALGDDFKTINGKEYKNATVSQIEPDGLVLHSKSGISKVYFAELPKEVQERFHYDAAQAAQFTTATQAAGQSFNEEVVRQDQERKRILDQRAAAAAQEQQQEMQQQQAIERQASIRAQRQRPAGRGTAASRTDPLNLKNIHRGLDGHIMSGTASNGVNATEKHAREQHQRRIIRENEAAHARSESRKAEDRTQELQRQAGEMRERERYEYNKAASERGNQATYNVEEAFDRKIQSLQGQINKAQQEKNRWESQAQQAEQY